MKLFVNANLILIIFSDMSKHTFSLFKHFQLKCHYGPAVQWIV